MPLARLRIKNYQSLRDVVIELGRFTVVVGESDIGKSSLVRAIKSVLINRMGQDFITHGQKQAGVALQFDHDFAVAWLKDESAKYRLSLDGKTTEFTKMGRGLPDEIALALKMGDVKVGNDSLNVNVHDQFDQPFLIADTPSLRARLLGELSGINLLYLGIQEARRREQAAKRLQTTRITDLEQSKTRLRQYQHLPQVKAGLAQVVNIMGAAKSIEMEVDVLKTSIGKLESATITAQQTEAQVKRLDEVAQFEPHITELVYNIDKLEHDLQQLDILETKVSHWFGVQGEIDNQLEKLEKELGKYHICPTCQRPISSEELKRLVSASGNS